MKKTILLSALCAVMLLAGCRQRDKGAGLAEELPFSPYVEAFTTGNISRTSPIYLILNEEIAADKLTTETAAKAMKITPAVAGEFAFESNRMIVFKPSGEMKRNTAYTITADLGLLLGAEGKEKSFAFRVRTMPLTLRAGFRSLDINAVDDTMYDISLNVYTPDAEDGETVESLIRFSERAEVLWEHEQDGKNHVLTLMGVPSDKTKEKILTVSVGQNRLGVARDDLLRVTVPSQMEFSVYDVTYVSKPERYVEVTFTRTLDAAQDLGGLAVIEDNRSETVTVSGNKLRLYPDAGRTGTLEVRLDRSIRSAQAAELGETYTHQVEISSDTPAVRFVGEGVVVPQSTQILVPFQAVHLRGVTVRVIRVLERNIGQFLQQNTLDGEYELVRVGRIVARKTVWLDEGGEDLSEWNTYAVDLKSMIDPEPGAIYRVELSYNLDLSAYPCEGLQQKTREQILAEDEVKLREELAGYDGGGWYYYSDFDWSDYNYNDRRNPCAKTFYAYASLGRNVMATNLGVIAKQGSTGEILLSVHNLLTTQPEKGVTVTAYNYQNQPLGNAVTDDMGRATLTLASGRAFYVTAALGNQRTYLRVDDGSSLSLSSFDVSGQVVQKGIKGFIYGDRGVWRPGDPIYMSFMLGDKAGTLPSEHPVVMELYTPLGQLYQRKTQTSGTLGVYSFEMQTDADSPTGAWQVRVVVGGVTFTKTIRIETIKPNRLKIDLSFGEDALLAGRPLGGKMHVEWLQGATAHNLKYEIGATFSPATTSFDRFRGYNFDDPSKEYNRFDGGVISGVTDAAGDATITGSFDPGTGAPGMLTGEFNTRVYEETGDFSIDVLRVPFSPYERYVGIKSPQTGRTQLNTGAKQTYGVASVDYKGQPVGNTKLTVVVYKVNWYWWWSSDRSRLASYVADSHNQPVNTFSVTTGADGTASFDLQFDDDQWGTYFISVRDAGGKHSTGTLDYYDWPSISRMYGEDGGTSPTQLNFKTDKEAYAPGEKIVLTVPSPAGSRAVVTVENGSRVISVSEHLCGSPETQITLTATADMQPNSYIYVSLLQPHGGMENDLPIRMYGVVPVSVTSPDSYLYPVITMADEVRPEERYEVTVSERGGREMSYTLAIVDEGLLDLTRFQTPDPWNAFNAREALGVRTWDMYNYVVGAYGGRLEQVFSIGGDDELNAGPKATVNRFKPVVQFSGPHLLKKGARQKHTFTMPNYNGRVRVMVIAGDGSAYGNTDKSVMVRKPVMLLGTLPRVIGIGEEMVVPATVFATENNVGRVTVSISTSDNMEIVGESTRQLDFSDITDKSAYFRIRVKDTAGAGKVTLTASSRNDRSVYETDIEIRSVRRPQTKVESQTILAGQGWSGTVAMPGAPGTNSLTLEVSDVQPVNLASRLGYLIGYPHGCLEQITSKGFPQLYVGQFANLTPEQALVADQAVKDVISRQRSYQMAEGSLSYWPGGTSSNAWSSIYAAHFQLEAEAKGYMVPSAMNNAVMNNLRLVARNWKPVAGYYTRSEELTQAYRLYVLALGRKTEMGAMNRLKEQSDLAPMAKWMLAAAYALAGRRDVAGELTGRTLDMGSYRYNEYDYTYGSSLRDKAIMLITLCLLDRANDAATLASDISATLSSDEWLNTQATSFALVAMSQYINKYAVTDGMQFSYSCAGAESGNVQTQKHVWSQQLLTGAGETARLEITNSSQGTLFVRVVSEGVPVQGQERAYANGLGLSVSYRDLNGRPVNIANMKQGTNFMAVATVRNPTANAYNNIVLTQILPAGWEILNTRFTDENAAGDDYPAGVSYQDIRDDRVYSYIDRLPAGGEVTITVNLAAVYAGSFYCPPVYAEAMYDNRVTANNEGRQIAGE